MKTVLVATVGGSDAPILNAIRQNEPDLVYFLCSAGDGPAASERTIEERVESPPRKNRCPLCRGSYTTTLASGPIAARAGLARETYEVLSVPSPDDLAEVVAVCERIEQDMAARMPGETLDVIANYTGGTKTMALGLGLYAYLTRGRWRLQVNATDRQDLVQIRVGDVAMHQHTELLRRSEAREAAADLAARFDYESAAALLAETLRDLTPRQAPPLSALHLRYLALAARDRLDYEDALAHAQESPDLAAEMASKLRLLLRTRRLLGSAEPWPPRDVTGAALLEDLLANAERCAARGRHDDAIARLYRATELLAQLRLRRAYGVHTASAETALGLLDAPGRAWLDSQAPPGPPGTPVKLALVAAYELLARLADPLGRRFTGDEERLRRWLRWRNDSLLAHGLEPVGPDAWRSSGEPWLAWLRGAADALSAPLRSPP